MLSLHGPHARTRCAQTPCRYPRPHAQTPLATHPPAQPQRPCCHPGCGSWGSAPFLPGAPRPLRETQIGPRDLGSCTAGSGAARCRGWHHSQQEERTGTGQGLCRCSPSTSPGTEAVRLREHLPRQWQVPSLAPIRSRERSRSVPPGLESKLSSSPALLGTGQRAALLQALVNVWFCVGADSSRQPLPVCY